MNSRRFIIYSVIYAILVALAVYSVNPSEYTITIFEYSLSLPVAIWVVIPVVIFAIFATLHILYHGLLVFKFKRALKKDEHTYQEMVRSVLLSQNFSKDFKTSVYDLASNITKKLSPWGSDINVDNAQLREIFEIIEGIKSGEVLDIKRYRLDKENPIVLNNELNKIEKLPNHYIEVLKNKNLYNEELVKKAYAKLINVGDFEHIRRYSMNIRTPKDVEKILNRFKSDDIKLNSDEIFEILNDPNIDSQMFVNFADILSAKLSPDAYLEIFKKLKETYPQAENAYIFVLFELSMIDSVREILQNSAPNEFRGFKVLLFLKEQSKIAPTSLFIDDRF